ncbi:MAG: hypothetical protein LBB40_03410 [Holophagales bacterium]|jgi:hypothetical protein|nr:hypothetical protein [Holophagales bacterium]
MMEGNPYHTIGPLTGYWWTLYDLSYNDISFACSHLLIEERISSVKDVGGVEAYYSKEAWTAYDGCTEQKAAVCAVFDAYHGSFSAVNVWLRAMSRIIESALIGGDKKIVRFLGSNSQRKIWNAIGGGIRRLFGILRVKSVSTMIFSAS